MAEMMNIRTGLPVFTADGESLGEVKETQGNFFKVEASMKPDYWLSNDCVRGGYGDRVEVEFNKNRLDSYKRDIPG
jgi:hypothetical protein